MGNLSMRCEDDDRSVAGAGVLTVALSTGIEQRPAYLSR